MERQLINPAIDSANLINKLNFFSLINLISDQFADFNCGAHFFYLVIHSMNAVTSCFDGC